MEIEDNTLTITADLTKEFGPTNTGQNILVASTAGPTKFPGRKDYISVIIYRPPHESLAQRRKVKQRQKLVDLIEAKGRDF